VVVWAVSFVGVGRCAGAFSGGRGAGCYFVPWGRWRYSFVRCWAPGVALVVWRWPLAALGLGVALLGRWRAVVCQRCSPFVVVSCLAVPPRVSSLVSLPLLSAGVPLVPVPALRPAGRRVLVACSCAPPCALAPSVRLASSAALAGFM